MVDSIVIIVKNLVIEELFAPLVNMLCLQRDNVANHVSGAARLLASQISNMEPIETGKSTITSRWSLALLA